MGLLHNRDYGRFSPAAGGGKAGIPGIPNKSDYSTDGRARELTRSPAGPVNTIDKYGADSTFI